MKRKGFRHVSSFKEIRAHMHLSAKHKLEWLEAANQFCQKTISGRTKRIWERFRQGTI